MKYHGICNRVFQKNTLNTIADDTNSAGDKIHPNVQLYVTIRLSYQTNGLRRSFIKI